MIKIKLTAFGAHIPKKATDGAAAYDLYVPDYTIITPGRNILNLGFQIELNPHTQGTVDPRSGYSSKGMEGYDKTMYVDGEIVPVSIFSKWFGLFKWVEAKAKRRDADVITGKIDEDYRGDCGVIIKSYEKKPFFLAPGTRIAQLTITEVKNDEEFVLATELSKTERDAGGFGHSNEKQI